MALDRATIDGYNGADLKTVRFSGWCSDCPYICQPNETRLREVVEGVRWNFPPDWYNSLDYTEGKSVKWRSKRVLLFLHRGLARRSLNRPLFTLAPPFATPVSQHRNTKNRLDEKEGLL